MTIAALMLALIASPNAEAGGKPIILDFHSAHCGPCQQMRPEVDRLIQKGYPVKSVDIDEAPSWAERYRVTAVPTFIIVDARGRALARTEGYQPAGQLAALYRQARAKVVRPAADRDEDAAAEDAPAEDAPTAETPTVDVPAAEPDEPADRDEPAAPKANPKPWETVVRIKVHGAGSIGFGSGTIIHSTPEESVILTCAHIFHLDGPQAPPSRFPRKITVDLFDGVLRGQTVHPVQTVAGRALDYDFTHDVGLIVIKPGRRLPASPVVPVGWKPAAGMGLTTVGCSEGNDATAWSTRVVQPKLGGDHGDGRAAYEGTLCVSAPKQGRSGGGLYTGDGYVAGVCDFADYERNRGIYAAPESIHRLLARNGLKALYTPGADRSGSMLAAQGRPATRPAAESVTLRGQSPDRAEPRAKPKAKTITIPKPEILGIESPAVAAAEDHPPAARPRRSWAPAPQARSEAQTADLKMDPAVADDPPAADPAPEPSPTRPSVAPPGKWRAVKKAPVARRTEEIDDK